MTDRPILFSGPMVRALLAGNKTQTRRVLKKPSWAQDQGWPERIMDEQDLDGRLSWFAYDTKCIALLPIPQPGDRLWVRESWAQHHPAGVQEGRFSIEGTAGIPGPPSVKYRVIFRADGDPVRVWHCRDYPYRTTEGPRDEIDAKHADVCSEFPGWSPSIHMPRWASRLTLTVKHVRVQRVQEISENDALAEGIVQHLEMEGWKQGPLYSSPVFPVWGPGDCWDNPIGPFRNLWDSLNEARGYGWDANPWVAAYTFTVEQRNIDSEKP